MTTTTTTLRPELDLSVSRIIAAPRSAVWGAWSEPDRFAKWWVPAPTVCRVLEMEMRPGGAFRTEMSDDGHEFVPHISGCFLDVVPGERIVWTDALVDNWRPAANSFVTSVITMQDHPDGTAYVATAMHRDTADRDRHEELGFQEGWSAVIEQLARAVEPDHA